ncbi:MAG: choice-of-anchor I family protein, partial [Bacteroidota bacterium]
MKRLYLLLMGLSLSVCLSAQTTVASQDFDTPLNLNSQMIDPDGSTFASPGDMFDVRNESSSLPFAIADDSFDDTCRGGSGSFPTDEQGFITCSYPDGNFFGVVDLDNNDNMDGMGTVDWEFQIDGATDLVVSIDMAAMGDFEASNDIFNFSYSFDDVTYTPLFSSSVDETAEQTYTMEGGAMPTISDPLSMNGIVLNENFQTILGALSGTGSVLYLRFEASNDGGSEAFAIDNIEIISGLVICPSMGDAFISEFHYDNTGGDTGEFVEVAVANSFAGDLADIVLTLYNGSNGTSYGTHDLSTFVAGEDDGMFTYYSKAVSGIQNGSPDGLALSCDDSVIEFLSYEGTFTAVDGPATDVESTDIGASEPSSTAIGSSLQLIDGVWSLTEGFNTQGAPNILEMVVCPTTGEAFINEFHYDNSGSDVNEFVEVAVANTFEGSVDDLTVTLYNGSGGAAYNSFNVGLEFTEGEDDGTFTYYTIVLPANGIQNGSPDGLALSCAGELIEFLSYEGTFTAIDGPAADVESEDIGVEESSDQPETGSLQLIDGEEWVLTCLNSLGAPNEAITDCCDLAITSIVVIDETCAGDANGNIEIVAGCELCGDIEFSFDGGETFVDTNAVGNLAEDCYTVIVRSTLIPDCEVERIVIVENDNPTVIPQVEELSFELEVQFDLNGAEIVTYIADNTSAAVTSGDGLQLVDLSDPFSPSLITTLLPTAEGFNSDEVSSTAYANGILAAAVPNDDTQMPGDVLFYDMDGTFLGSVEVGPLPDMIKFTPDGNTLLVANEGEPDDDYVIDPEGSVSVIDLSGGAASATVMTADFTAFNGTEDAIEADGGRIFGPGATVAQDLEPEFITVTDDGTTAFVTCQENNLLAEIDIATATVTRLIGLGVKAYCEPGNDLDASNRDDTINIQNWPFFGFYQPDGIECYSAGGNMYIVSANEGDARDYDGFSEEDRGDDLDLDDAAYPDEADLLLDENLGRIRVSNVEGDTDGDGDVDQITGFGGRSFSIWDAATGELVFDSGSDLGNISAVVTPTFFNANNGSEEDIDERSDDKGVEPEGITIKEIGGNVYAFIIFERAAGGFAVYNITDPVAPYFVTYVPGAINGDIAPEALLVIDPDDNPTDGFLVLIANEVSNTLSIYTVTDNKALGAIPTDALVQGGSGSFGDPVVSIVGGTLAEEVILLSDGSLLTVGVEEEGTVILETSVTDDNGCTTVETETIFVVPSFTPEVVISDPCVCNDDASPIEFDAATGTYTNPNDGTFGEVVSIEGLAGGLPEGLDFRVILVEGAIGVEVGDTLDFDPETMSYTIAFDHADDEGYAMIIDLFVNGQEVGLETLEVSNACSYPNPVFDPVLDPLYCSFEGAIALGANDPDDVNGPTAVTFTINGNTATEFNPSALGAGLHTVVMTYEGADDGNEGIAPAGVDDPAYPGCTQDVITVIEVQDVDVACIADINVTLDDECSAVIIPEMLLAGTFACVDDFFITIDGEETNVITGCGEHTYTIDILNGEEVIYSCWGTIRTEDKTSPVAESVPEQPGELFCSEIDDVNINVLDPSISRCFIVDGDTGIPLQANFLNTPLGRKLTAGGGLPVFTD